MAHGTPSVAPRFQNSLRARLQLLTLGLLFGLTACETGNVSNTKLQAIPEENYRTLELYASRLRQEIRQKRTEHVESALQEFHKRYGHYAWGLAEEAEIALLRRDPATAVAAFERVLTYLEKGGRLRADLNEAQAQYTTPPFQSQSYRNLVQAYLTLGQSDSARQTLERFQRYHDREGSQLPEAIRERVWLDLQRAHFSLADAADDLEGIIRYGTVAGDGSLRLTRYQNAAWYFTQVAEANRRLQRYHEADHAYQQVQEALIQRDDVDWLAGNYLDRAEVLAFAQAPSAEIRACLGEAMRLNQLRESSVHFARNQRALAALELREGNLAKVASLLDAATPILRADGSQKSVIELLIVQGDLFAAQGNPAAARSAWEEAFEKLGNRSGEADLEEMRRALSLRLE